MARYEFKLPDIGEGIAEAEIVAWHVQVGETIEEDQHIADLLTDKATVEMESPVAGRVLELGGEPGARIAIGSTLIVVDTDKAGQSDRRREDSALADGLAEESPAIAGAEPSSGEPKQEQRSGDRRESERRSGAKERRADPRAEPDRREGQRRGNERRAAQEREAETPASAPPQPRVLASPAVRQRARDLGIDLAEVRSAAGDRIRHSDLDAYLLYRGGVVQRFAAPPREDETIAIVGLRRRIAENLEESKRRIPHFSYVEEIDVTALESTRAMMNENRGDAPHVTMLPFLITALCRAVRDFPQVNARFDDDAGRLTRHGDVHVGVATQTDSGLMVPVLRNAESRDIWGLAAEIARLSEAARSGGIARDELAGSTITISSLGPIGGIVSTPVINRPEVAIVAVNKVVERPVVRNGAIEIRKMMNLSSSFDHRVVDGWDAASFIQRVKQLLENPLLLLSLA